MFNLVKHKLQFVTALGLKLGLVSLLSAGCCTTPRNPVPEAYSQRAIVPGFSDARIWGDEAPPYYLAWMNASEQEIQAHFSGIVGQPHHYLALSGGGPLGAFGAGLLCGWTEHGDRPQFTTVTGISAGGLMAPFVFLGAEYDEVLETFFTQYASDDIFKRRSLISLLWRDAALDSAPLKALIDTYVDAELIAKIAAERRTGRKLMIGTTNLDAERPVLWDIGKIADSGDENALPLIRNILLASASIAGAFPPVMLEVQVGEDRFDEMHVDGGAVSLVSAFPAGIDWGQVAQKLKVQGDPKLYVIQNFFVDPRWRSVERKLAQIASFSMFTLIRNQGVGDLHRIYGQAQRDGVDFNLAHIPADFRDQPTEAFDPVYMKSLFDIAYQLGKNGYAWKKAPPGVTPE